MIFSDEYKEASKQVQWEMEMVHCFRLFLDL